MGTTAPPFINNVSNPPTNRSICENIVRTTPNGQAKRKCDFGDSGVLTEISAPKVKRNHEECETDFSDSESNKSSNCSNILNIDADELNNQNKQSVKKVNYQLPIVVTIDDKVSFLDIKNKIGLNNQYTTLKCNRKQVTLLTFNPSAFSEILHIFKTEGIQFHTYSRKGDIKPKVILKGLPVINTDFILEELSIQNIKPVNINLIRSKNNTNNSQATFLITVNDNDTLKEIVKMKQLSNIIVHWEEI
ncbi:hypothetical protein PV325_010468 [Microctonus aethiopoides]|uniref:Pre-C2HC domain-containing protein n=1 Tax=Microctonus aethiopoides TaxID=144406 RepID=A0AA39KX60_9HYME|nr:hypothetical protein PV325_010468 [Microctonus aethiopoides]KAK0176952.1 hypothetical protein PV328_001050 [Microctonus aethiopoides]